MKRIVVLGQSGGFGASWCEYAAARLAQRLDMRCIRASEPAPSAADPSGWVATARVGALSAAMLRLADTAIWLHFLPPAVTQAWLRGLRARLRRAALHVERQPGLPDLRDSLIHMAWTPYVHRLLRHPALAHLQVFHLRSPDETDFWLRAQEHRLTHSGPSIAQPA